MVAGNYVSTQSDAAFNFLNNYFNSSNINDDPTQVVTSGASFAAHSLHAAALLARNFALTFWVC